ncbi:MAG TPA: tRNA guanosine(34) transglycosylase Tgt, partial [Candidatus Limnocylindria bacterium]|nr:tRNA guanosine(34) transglycosylase Tgt [Candidatus Limnocylindria bacterium]
MSALTFELLATDGAARRGRVTTGRAVIETPVFMPVGTLATVKSLTPDDLERAGASIILGNTYHLMLRPGHELIRELGGLHRFMSWPRALLTDSGGFQVFSLAKLRTITEEGVRFRSPVNGDLRLLSPEGAIEIQHALGADIIHPLDECLAYPAGREATERSLALTLRWARRSLQAHHAREGSARQALFGIVQGGSHADLRARAVEETVALGFDGYAIGGLAVGEPKPEMLALTEGVAARLPRDRPRYLMGVGKPEDLVECVARGVDMFDCVLPTRNARNGQAFTAAGPLSIKQARYTRDPAPLDTGCACETCRTFSRAYLRHLFMAGELLAYRLLSLHNVHFFVGLMAAMRQAISERAFEPFRTRFFSRYAVSSAEVSPD